MDIQSFINQFEQRLRIQRYSDATIRNYKSALNNFLVLADKNLASITPVLSDMSSSLNV
ncbi:MAG: site-specific integrase [Paludibacter sp.]|nr:site-specific integrase [Paludibacter sp.]